MQRTPPSGRSALAANTVIWIAVVLWLTFSYLGQTPPEDAYTDAFRSVFTWVLVVLIPVVSAFIALNWVFALRERGRSHRDS